MEIKKVTAATLKKRNARFAKLKKGEQRVEIAKDVILYIKSKNLIAEQGSEFDRYDFEGSLNDSIQETFGGVTCDVCAKGALFFSSVMRNGDCTYRDVIDEPLSKNSSGYKPLLKFFTHKQLACIETAFEDQCYESHYEGFGNILDAGELRRAHNFYAKYRTPKGRMLAIMKNIIKNEGTFKP